MIRGIEVQIKTVRWLTEYTTFTDAELLFGGILIMRPAADHRPDHELKYEWLNRMLIDDRERLVAVFDDRDTVVGMWRAAGISCFQVAEWKS